MFVLPHDLARYGVIGRHGFRCGHTVVEVALGNRGGVAISLALPQRVSHHLHRERQRGVLARHVQQIRSRTEGRRTKARSPVRHDDEIGGRVRIVHRPRALGLLRIGNNRERRAERRHRHALRRIRERLRRPHLLAGHVGLREHRGLHDRIDRLAVLAVEEIQEAVFPGRADAFDGPAPDVDVEQHRPRHQVPVPEVMMNRLVVPGEFSRIETQRDDRVGEQVHPTSRGSLVVG